MGDFLVAPTPESIEKSIFLGGPVNDPDRGWQIVEKIGSGTFGNLKV